MTDYIEKPDVQYILHIKSDKKVEKRLIDYCLESVVDVFEDTGMYADVQPIKHGRWIGVDFDTYFECSECKYLTDWQFYKYCPYCGARMDGDTND